MPWGDQHGAESLAQSSRYALHIVRRNHDHEQDGDQRDEDIGTRLLRFFNVGLLPILTDDRQQGEWMKGCIVHPLAPEQAIESRRLSDMSLEGSRFLERLHCHEPVSGRTGGSDLDRC